MEPVSIFPKKKIGVRTIRTLKQTGTSNIPVDRKRKAKLPGKRISASGNIYFETRKNRSDARGKRV